MKEYDAVLAVDVLNEGADWEDAECAIDLAPSTTSLVKAYQRFGRLLRDIPNKTDIEYCMFLPFGAIDVTDQDDRRRNCSEVFTALMIAMNLREMIAPVKIIKDKKKGDGPGGRGTDFFKKQVPDPNERDDIYREVCVNLIALAAEKEKKDKKVKKSEVKKRIEITLKQFGIKRHVAEITSQIWGSLRNAVCYGLDVKLIMSKGFDQVHVDEFYKGLKSLSTGMCGADDFSKLRDAYGKVTLAEAAPHLIEEWHPTLNDDLTTNGEVLEECEV
jgi:hypothetical protein